MDIDFNTATASDLVRKESGLVQLGKATAANIIEKREAMGGSFETLDDLLGIPRITKALIATWKKQGARVDADESESEGDDESESESESEDEDPRSRRKQTGQTRRGTRS